MKHDRPALSCGTTSKARRSTPLWPSVRAAAGCWPVTVSSRRFLGQPGAHSLSKHPRALLVSGSAPG